MSKPSGAVATLALAAIWAGRAGAQVGVEEADLALVYGDQDTVSIATGTTQPLRRAPAVASVITAEEIAAMAAQSLDDVLESVPGLHLSRASVRYAALYGADAYAGLINVITKTAADTSGVEAGASAGSFGTWKTWGQYGGKLGPFDAAAYPRLGGTEGGKEIIESDAQTRNDVRFGTHASLAPGLIANDLPLPGRTDPGVALPIITIRIGSRS